LSYWVLLSTSIFFLFYLCVYFLPIDDYIYVGFVLYQQTQNHVQPPL
jgi:hypothetical protein